MPVKNSTGFLIAFLLMIALIMFSIFFFFLAVNAYSQGFKGTALYYSMAGLMGLILSTYTLARMILRKPSISTVLDYEVRTFLQCLKCGFSNTRSFINGDYVLSFSDKCPHCSSLMVILAIYKTTSKKKER
ncbi:hypothetical protein KEJ27_00490 [Candidatus Bathyarchaeota archaeon]|nr:hypothetical protein [Candidatus Bathyarchaeota archaeon]MBS7617199.1 hypothetical protein [Candidatus Bathyarchaeota archaeon]